MTPWEILGSVLIAAMSAGGPIALLITTRTVQKAQGQGDQIDRRLENIELFLESMVDSGTNLTKRLNGHDREFDHSNQRLDDHAERIKTLESQ